MSNNVETLPYRLAMGAANAAVAGVLLLAARYYATIGGDSWIIALVALIASCSFALMVPLSIFGAIGPARLRRWLPGGDDTENHATLSPLSELDVPAPLPDTFTERCGTIARRAGQAPGRVAGRALARRRQPQGARG